VIDPQLEGGEDGDLRASIYPNPAYSDDIHNGTSPTSITLPSANLNPGVYVVVINTADAKMAKKFIVAGNIR